MATNMSIGPVLGNRDTRYKVKYRWMLQIGEDNIAGNSANMLPPLKSARPTLEFKEVELEHWSETVYMPTKAIWQPIDVTLYDVADNFGKNKVFEWVKSYYNSKQASYGFIINDDITKNLKKTAYISLYSGNGCCIESWVLENAYPNSIVWGDLNMEDSSVVTIDFKLRYDRAYVSTSADSIQTSEFVNYDGCLDYKNGVC